MKSNASLQAPSRRRFLAVGLTTVVVGSGALSACQDAAAQGPLVEVWKDPSCGCCGDWMAHLKANGFRVAAHDDGNTDKRRAMGVPQELGSCHTAVVDRYVIEGHVPAVDIQRLLKEKTVALGLAVPGMPIGSPGMDGPEYGGRREAYDVLVLFKDAAPKVFQRYG